MSPTRRTFLRTGSLTTLALVAGCTGGGGESTDEPTTDEPTTGEPTTTDELPGGNGTGNGTGNGSAGGTRPAGTGGPGVILASVDDAPDLPVTPTVEVTKDVATKDHPPQLRVTVTNDGDEAVTIGEGRAVVFAYVTSQSDQLILLPAGEEYPAKSGCWRLTEGIAVTEEYRTITLQPGESVSQEVDLYGSATGDGCLPVGEHRFETTYNVMRGETPTPGSDEGQQAKWGFSVLLE